jgi:Ankyrin repeats (3 copies)
MQTRAQSRRRAASEAALALLLERVATGLPPLVLVLVLRPLPAVELARLACVHKAYWLVLVQLREEHPGSRYAKPLATDHYRHVSRLLRAAVYGDVAVLGSMIEAGVDERGVSLQHNARQVISLALTYAAESGYLHVVELLIRAGANVHYGNERALVSACRQGHHDVVVLLLANNADVHAAHDSALFRASLHGRTAIVQLLIQRGADVNARNNEAIRCASENGHMDVVQLLLEHGAILPAP